MCRVPRDLSCAKRHMLDAPSAGVKGELKRLLARRSKSKSKPPNANTGSGTTKRVGSEAWRREHELVRKAFDEHPNCLSPPWTSVDERSAILETMDIDKPLPWKHLYSPREADLVELLECALDLHGYRRNADIYADLTEPTTHTRAIVPGVVPTQLRTHKIYWFEGQRHLLGLEHMFMLGFPHSLKRDGISDVQLRGLAGNSMSLHFLCTLIVCVLCYVDMETDVVSTCTRRSRKVAAAPVFEMSPHCYTSQRYRVKHYLPGSLRGLVM